MCFLLHVILLFIDLPAIKKPIEIFAGYFNANSFLNE